jgi:hypothetical protein
VQPQARIVSLFCTLRQTEDHQSVPAGRAIQIWRKALDPPAPAGRHRHVLFAIDAISHRTAVNPVASLELPKEFPGSRVESVELAVGSPANTRSPPVAIRELSIGCRAFQDQASRPVAGSIRAPDVAAHICSSSFFVRSACTVRGCVPTSWFRRPAYLALPRGPGARGTLLVYALSCSFSVAPCLSASSRTACGARPSGYVRSVELLPLSC